ncbi:hypothetical protein KL905_004542 [Ogataea polymorpha]|uniref:Uncharacterized protein n=1 Tax=Ogataea polymorpha TaxID=460523 RepID=A0A1B7SBY8_9ASCO|nr:uncharacterized protein OGAPODRAFT_96072 [Ogataea polymorpha]KAG7878068.1 hypothetical protein KL937_004216 [Ogataea polymorpha]KAG7916812.1 hypothetical protein KL905_004542 [Ogataea polymorpha]KAG7930858.1 hypothetical protein KL934_004484 [Ogataea polymorpha]KAG7932606.1 hypothetical protein KL904_004397 [Ogataea polymorpha]KAH3675290.1 hypothetical protein OGATHE_001630 [Ogataea polymorpha]
MVTNTLVVTDQYLLDQANSDLLDEFLASLQKWGAEDKSVSISVLRSLRRIVIIFDTLETAQKVYEVLQSQGFRVTYSRRNSARSESQLEVPARLEPPERRVELQSPPPSPYLGYVQEPEEPPELITMTEPQSFSHLLYQPTHDEAARERVFSGREEEPRVPLLIVDREEGEALRKRQQEIEREKLEEYKLSER